MYELNGKLQQAEWKKNSKKQKRKKIRNFGKGEKLLEEEMDEHFKAQFEEN